MPVDASIPLQIQQYQAPDMLGEAAKGLQLQGMQQENQIRQSGIEAQKAEAEAFKGADFSTPEGRNATLVNLMQKSPQAGMALMKQFAEMDKNKAQAEHWTAQASKDQLEATQKRQEILANASLPAWNAYQKALSEGKPDQVARAEADKLMPQVISQIQGSHILNDDEMARLPRTFDPIKVGSGLIISGMQGKMIKQKLEESQIAETEQKTKKEKEETENPEKFHPKRESSGEWELLQGEDGKTYSVNKVTGEKKEIDQSGSSGKLTKPGTGGSKGGNNRIQQRVASVVGAAKNAQNRLDEIQKDYGNNYNVSMIFGSHPEGLTGKSVDALYRHFQDPKQQTYDATVGQFIDEATTVYTGGLRSSDSFRKFLISQLPQPGGSPEAAAKKWELFKKNIEGIDSTFRQAFATNPDYWGKKNGEQPAVTASDVQQMQEDLKNGGKEAGTGKAAPRPKAGQIFDTPQGKYKFKGGDPNDQSNYEKQAPGAQ